MGCRDLPGTLELLRQDACERGIPLRLFGLLPEERDRLEALYPGRFRFHSVRDSADYVYETEQLAQLHGKKLQAKRNHCNRFEAAYPDYRVLPLTADQLPRCRAFTDEWYRLHFLENDPADYALEPARHRAGIRPFRCARHDGSCAGGRGRGRRLRHGQPHPAGYV